MKGTTPPNPRGRPKGALNKATVEHRAWLGSVFESEEYRAMFERKLRAGTLPSNIWQDAINRAYGKVRNTVELGGSLLEKLLDQGAEPLRLPAAAGPPR